MDEQHWNRIRQLFQATLERPAGEREAYLLEAGAGDVPLIEAVRRMLDADASAHRFLDAQTPCFKFQEPRDERGAMAPPGTGPYRLLDELGRGGMGIVYRAERADGTFERAVALKLVRVGFDSNEALARFHAERRVLAGLEHSNVARLYDAGVADDGRPYLVMELVDGTRIDRYCDAERLDAHARIELFRQVCDAVQHAHRSLVIHRDLKPSNILVAGDGSAKLLDFGIAKLTEDDTAGASPRTRTGLRLLTPEYASPEQIRGEPLTTNSDVYSLGAILYELLTGRRPFDDWVGAAAYALDPDTGCGPALPSRAVTAAVGAPTVEGVERVTPEELAGRRASTPDRLQRTLRGDLDRIVLKALARSSADRYDSAQALSDDLGRYLTGLPVTARPASLPYRIRKFARRHWAGVAVTAVIIVSLGLGTGAVARQARVAAAERDVAVGVSDFLERLFSASDPRVLDIQDTTRMIDFLAAMGDRIETELGDQPRTRARMLLVLGLTHKNIGRTDRAEPLLRAAIDENRAVHGDRHADVAEAERLLGLLLADQDRFDEAIPMMESALATQAALTGESSWEVGRLHESLGQALLSAGETDRAVPHVEASLAIRRNAFEPDDPVIANSLNTLAALKSRQGQDEEAIALLEQAIEAIVENPATVPEDIGVQRMNLASFLMRAGRFNEALDQARQGHRILESNTKIQWIVASSRARLAEAIVNVWRETDDDALAHEADSLFLSGIELMRTLPEAGNVRYLLHPYAQFLQRKGDLVGAEAAAREALALEIAATGTDNPATQPVRAVLAGILMDAGRPAEAEALAAVAHAALEGTLPAAHPTSIMVATILGRALAALGRADDATSVLSAAWDTARTALGARHHLTLSLEAALDSLAGGGGARSVAPARDPR